MQCCWQIISLFGIQQLASQATKLRTANKKPRGGTNFKTKLAIMRFLNSKDFSCNKGLVNSLSIYLYTRDICMIQLVSQLKPSSLEKACCQRALLGLISDQV
jgi:hypothetical protein